MIPVLVKWTKWTILIPLQVIGAGCLFFLDQLLPRYLLAAVLVAPLAALGHFVFGVSLIPFLIASLVLGTALAGLWENSEAFSSRALFGLLGRQDVEEPRHEGIEVERVTVLVVRPPEYMEGHALNRFYAEVDWLLKEKTIEPLTHHDPITVSFFARGERHAQRAVAYGLTLLGLLQRWHREQRNWLQQQRKPIEGFHALVGVETVCLAFDGNEPLAEADFYRELNPTVGFALGDSHQRLEGVCVSRDTYLLVKDEFEVRDPAGRLVKMPGGEIRVWDVVGWKK